MSISGKKHQKALEVVKAKKPNNLKEVFDLVVKTAHTKFDESVDVDVVLGVDASKGEQGVRGSVLLPHGTGKTKKVLVFAKGEYEEQAKAAGADFVGLDDMVEKILGGWMDFDVAIATPDVMGVVGKVAKLLGPRGLLPNKKDGTVSFELESLIKDLKNGRVSYRNDKGGILHANFGKVSFGGEKLEENFLSLIKSVASNKPVTSKGKFIKKITVSSTMGVGVSVDPTWLGY
ncbi:TPA: 50S ribosomal protein L1 [Candidatus Dependentiae bacterium]|nr:MAG: 50S ribosomal protein L1 [candidate division TM6 bacterium GW2011_GWE2_31_21]KKP54045.1 MAG: 50S ribosomal protein L1 [candidate division TM6 bacterium GW2011_GWF2_33_332]HBS48372.1 50S ribosomal protein L1 [Candidatus Dependentiae bacterium]HBZ72954.1 50S ribosomal protein L1 [Candidatus Dependentiae bacterium]